MQPLPTSAQIGRFAYALDPPKTLTEVVEFGPEAPEVSTSTPLPEPFTPSKSEELSLLASHLSRTGLEAKQSKHLAVQLHVWLRKKKGSCDRPLNRSVLLDDVLLDRVDHLQHLLSGPVLLRVLKHCPTLLDLKVETIVNNFNALQKFLLLPLTRAQRLIGSQPSLLMVTPVALGDRVKQLSLLLEMEESEVLKVVVSHPRLLLLRPRTLSEKLDQVAVMLDLPLSRVRQLFRRQPVLFALSAASIHAKSELLRTLLGLTREELLNLLLLRAGILTSSLPTLQEKYFRLQDLLGQDTSQVLMTDSRLLSSSTTVLQQRWQMLESLVSEHPAWKQELAHMPAYCKAIWLSSPTRCNRLAFLIAIERVKDLSLVTAITLPTQTFAGWYPGYRSWSSQEVPVKSREAVSVDRSVVAEPGRATGKRRRQKHAVEVQGNMTNV